VRIFSKIFLVLLLASCTKQTEEAQEAAADLDLQEEVIVSPVDNFIEKPFRIKETITVRLDGSEEAQAIERQSQNIHQLVFMNKDNWRVRRQLPFNESIYEYLKENGIIYSMTASNKKIEAQEKIEDQAWMEVIISPLRLAQAWSLVKKDITFADFLEDLEDEKEPLKNLRGDEMVLEKETDESGKITLKIISKGSVLHEGKTKVNIESIWELDQTTNVTAKDLEQSLIRSL
jgi:hypothetical protein